MKWTIYVKNGTRYDGLLNKARPSLEDLKNAETDKSKYTTLDVEEATGFNNEADATRFISEGVHPYLQPHCQVFFAFRPHVGKLYLIRADQVESFLKLAAKVPRTSPETSHDHRLRELRLIDDQDRVTTLGENVIAELTRLENLP
jgi:hypothetical protein